MTILELSKLSQNLEVEKVKDGMTVKEIFLLDYKRLVYPIVLENYIHIKRMILVGNLKTKKR